MSSRIAVVSAILAVVFAVTVAAAPPGDFKCYVCYPNGPNLQRCNEPQASQLVSCPSGICWMTMREESDKSLIVTRGCGKAMEAPALGDNDCQKNRDRATGVTEQICNCSANRCNKNSCKSKSKCFV